MMAGSPWIPAGVALALWWISTGVLLVLVRRAEHEDHEIRLKSVLGALPLLIGGVLVHWLTRNGTGASAAYGGFGAALAVWGWIELAFLSGIITGPNRRPCPENAPEWQRFMRAWGTVAYHEIVLGLGLVFFYFSTLGVENTFGFWTYAVLFFARISAKLNLYLGVPSAHTEFLPRALAHLPTYFRVRRLNWLFPISVTVLTFAVACWLERLWAAETAFDLTGFALLTAITALALLEHWLLVLPVPDQKLWRWMLPEPRPMKTPREDLHGL